MNPTPTQKKNTTAILVAGIIVLVIIIAIVHRASRSGSMAPADATLSSATTSMDMASTTAPATMTPQTFAFAVYLASSTYRTTDVIHMTVAVLNLTDKAQTLTFKDGCQGDYTIGSFDMIQHTTCQPGPTYFTVDPHSVKSVPLAHYPSIYMIPPGTYSLKGTIIGYGSMTAPITITN